MKTLGTRTIARLNRRALAIRRASWRQQPNDVECINNSLRDAAAEMQLVEVGTTCGLVLYRSRSDLYVNCWLATTDSGVCRFDNEVDFHEDKDYYPG